MKFMLEPPVWGLVVRAMTRSAVFTPLAQVAQSIVPRTQHANAVDSLHTKVYPKVSALAAWSENCKWYSSLPLGAILSLFCESV
jgi:hypothetical protein